ncbi:hypothetical protein FRC04_001786 [Tulasnella sp. 424]|nr:hypothetical protein FRC04_001786 [Tulasnella sp. 424]KAG8968179.1 hypothetical protein FRC05_001656 [Tulasnella sp. 425]
MSLANSRPETPGPRSVLKVGGEANVGEDATYDTVSFIEPTIVFQVQNALFGVPRSQVLKSGFFRGMMESPHLGDSKEGSAEHPIVLDERTKITRGDMKNFCAVLDIRACESAPTLSVADWASAYRLAKMWEFEHVREYIYKHLDVSITDPFERIEYADALGFSQWVAPALCNLCTRDAAFTAAEGGRLGLVRFAELCRLREMNRPKYNTTQYDGWLNKAII